MIESDETADDILTEVEVFYKGWRSLIPQTLMKEVQDIFKVGALLILEKV